MESWPLPIYVMNLDRSKDRWLSFEKRNSHLKQYVSRFAAVDGKNASRDLLANQGIIARDLQYNDGALGSALSHLTLWNLAIERNQAITICEDDAIFNLGFIAAAEPLVKTLPKDWHVMFWGWNFDSVVWFDVIPGVTTCVGQFDQQRMRKGVEAFQSANLNPQLFRLFQAFGMPCYSISVAGAQNMKRFCLPFRNIDVPIPGLGRTLPNRDLGVVVNDVFPKINTFVSFPPLVVTPNDHNISTVQTTSAQIR